MTRRSSSWYRRIAAWLCGRLSAKWDANPHNDSIPFT